MNVSCIPSHHRYLHELLVVKVLISHFYLKIEQTNHSFTDLKAKYFKIVLVMSLCYFFFLFLSSIQSNDFGHGSKLKFVNFPEFLLLIY